LEIYAVNLARVSANGQITVPVEIRRLLNVKEGNKLLFMRKDNGEVVVSNASLFALQEAQEAFAGLADEIGYTEEQILEDVMKIRYGENA
jgi:AbrB family looped-hinge helix DNA binding protein